MPEYDRKRKPRTLPPEYLPEEVQREAQCEEPKFLQKQIVPDDVGGLLELSAKMRRRDVEMEKPVMREKDRLAGERLHIGHQIIGDRIKVVKSPISVKIVSDIHETLNRLKADITKDQEENNLDPVRASMARTYINRIKQEVEREKPNKVKMLRYLKKIEKIAGYVAEKVTDVGKVVTVVGEAANTIESLFGKARSK